MEALREDTYKIPLNGEVVRQYASIAARMKVDLFELLNGVLAEALSTQRQRAHDEMRKAQAERQ